MINEKNIMKGTKREKKVLFIYAVALSSFKQGDLDILKKHFGVRVIKYNGLRSLFELLRGVLWADVTFSWFAGEYAFWAALLSKIFRKKSVVVAGGGEVAKIPEIGYGTMLNPRAARKVKLALKYSDKVLAVSEFNKEEISKYTDLKKIKLVYNAVEHEKFKQGTTKEKIVLTVTSISNINVKQKGLETFIEASKYLPDTKFIIIGKPTDESSENLKSNAPSNVDFLGFIPNERLVEYYQKAKVYVQVSAHESFGCSLAEAMLCECVPVVTNRAAIPEVVGDTGFYVPYGDPEVTAEAIKEALKSDKGKDARERIENIFPIERREKELGTIINQTLEGY